MTGAYLSNKVSHYIGNEPSTKTFDGLLRLKADIEEIDRKEHKQETMQITLEKRGSEDPETVLRFKGEVDFCFTSPPYYNTEQYSNEETQSFIKFPEYDQWKNEFLKATVLHCSTALQPDGLLAINIANVAKAKSLEQDTIEIVKSAGFFLHDTLQLQMSGRSGSGANAGQYRYEPIFVFTKTEREVDKNETMANLLF